MPKNSSAFQCSECGWQAAKWAGRCPECQQWGTVVEAGTASGIVTRIRPSVVADDRVARRITDIGTVEVERWSCGISEFDRVLGGGVVPGAAVLLSGEPGVGKSTLLLEVAARAAREGRRVLYVSAEESVGQVRLRAQRTNALSDNLYLAAETDLATVLGQVEAVSPDLLIVDSVQTVASATIDGLAGQPSQVREVASALMRLAKERNLPLVLVGHVTKDGSIAGPRVLEHLVDVVCHFEGDRHTALRFIRALKNRFGPTDEVGCFEMTGDGIAQVADPSKLFLSRTGSVSGTCITVSMEGKRAIPVEIQALVIKTSAPNPRRVVNGVDASRVAMLLAVLERRCAVKLSEHDVYVSTVGGVRLTEPAADLAIAIAIASAASTTEWPIPETLAAYGEISLAGEVRPVTAAPHRASEARRLGYRTLVDSSVGSLRTALNMARSSAGPVVAPEF